MAESPAALENDYSQHETVNRTANAGDVEVSERNHCPLSCVVEGVTWFLYAFDYTTADGKYGAHFYAISDEHAQLILQELKETATLRGRLQGVVDA